MQRYSQDNTMPNFSCIFPWAPCNVDMGTAIAWFSNTSTWMLFTIMIVLIVVIIVSFAALRSNSSQNGSLIAVGVIAVLLWLLSIVALSYSARVSIATKVPTAPVIPM